MSDIDPEILELFEEEQNRGRIPAGNNRFQESQPRIVSVGRVVQSESQPRSNQCPNCGEGELVVYDQAFRQCNRCGRGYTTDQLERLEKMSRRAQDARDLRDCWQEQLRMGSRGGGSGDKGPKKEDKLGSRSVAQMKAIEWTEEEAKVVKQNSLEPKGKIRTIKGLPEGTNGEQIRAAAARKLGI